VDRPVQLRCEIINPPFVEPEFRVSIQLVILVKALDGGGIPRPPDTERTKPKFYMRLFFFDFSVKSFDENIHRVSSPVAARKFTTTSHISITTRGIREVFIVVIGRIRVEVIVKMNTVYIISFYKIHYNSCRMILCSLLRRIEPPVTFFQVNRQFR